MSKVKNIKTLSKTKYLSLYSADYTNKKGNLKKLDNSIKKKFRRYRK